MRKFVITMAALSALIIAGCGGTTSGSTTTVVKTVESSAQTQPDTETQPETQPETETQTPVRKVTLPSLVGMNHQEAQDTLQAKGLYNLHERDCKGLGRILLIDSNWRVVRQTPKAGTRVSENRPITLCSVKYTDS